MSSLDGEGTIPNFRTTQQQLASFVPYVEYIRSGSNVTGLRWRIVNPSDVDTPVVQTEKMRFRVMNVDKADENFYKGTWLDIEAGESPEGTLTFDTPIAESELWAIEARLITNEGDTEMTYSWVFYSPRDSQPDIWMNHVSNASLVNGKADYSNAEFIGLVFDPFDDYRLAEAKYFTDEGRITIPDGGYTLRDYEYLMNCSTQ